MRSSPIRLALALAALVAAAGCNDVPIAPEDWDSALVEVSPCTQSGDHAGRFVRILVTAGQETTFATKSGTFPAGTVVLKPEYADRACTDLEELTAMRKDAPGEETAESGLGWSWQSLDAELKVLERPVASCISCHRSCPGGFESTCLDR